MHTVKIWSEREATFWSESLLHINMFCSTQSLAVSPWTVNAWAGFWEVQALSTYSQNTPFIMALNVHSMCWYYVSNVSQHMTKPTKLHVHPAKTQINVGIHPVWSESSLCTQWVAKDPSFLHVDCKDSDQTGWIPRPIWVFTGHMSFCWFCHALSWGEWGYGGSRRGIKEAFIVQSCYPHNNRI